MRKPTRTPDLEELLRVVVQQASLAHFGSMPGRVVRYDHKKQKADVLPLLKSRTIAIDGEEIIDTLPELKEVPVAFQRGGGGFISFGLKPGDHVMLVFQDRSIDQWATTERDEVIDPIDFRAHDLADAVALPMLYPFRKALGDADPDHLVVGIDGGPKVTLREDEIEIDAGQKIFIRDGDISLTKSDPGDKISLDSKVQTELKALRDSLNNLITAYNAHMHPTAAVGPPSGPTVPGIPPAPVGLTASDLVKTD